MIFENFPIFSENGPFWCTLLIFVEKLDFFWFFQGKKWEKVTFFKTCVGRIFPIFWGKIIFYPFHMEKIRFSFTFHDLLKKLDQNVQFFSDWNFLWWNLGKTCVYIHVYTCIYMYIEKKVLPILIKFLQMEYGGVVTTIFWKNTIFVILKW